MAKTIPPKPGHVQPNRKINKHFLCPAALAEDIGRMAAEQHTNETQVIIQAIKLYRASLDLERSPLIGEDFLAALDARNSLLSKSITRSIDHSIHALAVNVDVLMQVLAHTVALDDSKVYLYRTRAQKNLKQLLAMPSIERAMEQEHQDGQAQK